MSEPDCPCFYSGASCSQCVAGFVIEDRGRRASDLYWAPRERALEEQLDAARAAERRDG